MRLKPYQYIRRANNSTRSLRRHESASPTCCSTWRILDPTACVGDSALGTTHAANQTRRVARGAVIPQVSSGLLTDFPPVGARSRVPTEMHGQRI
jgi:hypothetical protein